MYGNKRKRDPYRSGKASRMNVNHGKGSGVPGTGNRRYEGPERAWEGKKVSKAETSIGKSA